ncbi:DNA-binding death effector domain-containing protein 2-like [Chiloscyllium plagiosum]|uniref:DNA-binding death effector domain-containing protein 2-like n=1 Tax=Chiloscyllium plagiosum TaxID=36176 RepID=UPI001CB7BE35|nr:DNA-binding death effector domain-containing protein 2-like [Chiloscyllium plagiosum]
MAAAGPLKRARWQEEDTLASYRMLSLHQMFELVGSQLSRADVEALSFLLAEAYPLQRALRAGEEMEAEEGAAADDAVPGPRAPAPAPAWDEPGCCSSGVRLLFELERRGLCDETNFRHLLQLLRVISRHDLLPYVGCNRGRAVSPERSTCRGPVSRVGEQVESCLNSERAVSMQSGWEPGASLTKRHTATRRIRGSGKRRGYKRNVLRNHEREHQAPHQPRATCDIRLRVRAVYSDQNTVLRGNVVSVKQDPLDRCFDLFGQANTILKSRDLGSIICDIKFSELSYLDAFWNDYINGSLLEALKGVFITDSLKQAVGQEAIQLLVNVDEDDYEKGRRVLQNICP